MSLLRPQTHLAGPVMASHGQFFYCLLSIRSLGTSITPSCGLSNRCRYDAACHLAEEMPNPSRNVPISMLGSVLVNGIMGFAYCLMLLFSIGDLETLLTTSTGFPFMQLFLNVTQSSAGATVLTLTICLVATAANAAGLTSTSRTYQALAGDSTVPKSSYFSHVHPTLKVPVRAVILITILQAQKGFIYLGNTTAFNAILSMAILGMYLSYLLSGTYMLLFGRAITSETKKTNHVFGPFQLG